MQERRTHDDQTDAQRTPAQTGPVQGQHPLLGLQRSAGNSAVANLVAVQRNGKGGQAANAGTGDEQPLYANATGAAAQQQAALRAVELAPATEKFNPMPFDDLARAKVPAENLHQFHLLGPHERLDLMTGLRTWADLTEVIAKRESFLYFENRKAVPTTAFPAAAHAGGELLPGAVHHLGALGAAGDRFARAQPEGPAPADHPPLVSQESRPRANAYLRPPMTKAAPPTVPLHTTGAAAANVLNAADMFATGKDTKKILDK
jgi:hypothetical protein